MEKNKINIRRILFQEVGFNMIIPVRGKCYVSFWNIVKCTKSIYKHKKTLLSKEFVPIKKKKEKNYFLTNFVYFFSFLLSA